MFKKWIMPLIAIGGILSAITYLKTATPPPPVAKPLAQPALVPYQQYIGGVGLTEPSSENIVVGVPVPGVVRDIYIKVGDYVKKNDKLFLIEDRESQARSEQMGAQLNQAKAELKDQQDQMTIINSIEDDRAISKDERNRKTNALAVAKAKVSAVEADLKAAQTDLELHTVRAPISGTIMTMNLRLGEYASTTPGSDPFIRMGNLDPLRVRVDIDENDAWRFEPGAEAIAFVRGNPEIKVPLAFVRVEPYVRPKKSLTGESTERVDTRVLQIIYEVAVKDKPIYAGQQMDVYIEAKPKGTK